MIVAFPCAVGLFVLAKPIMMLLFGDSDQTTANIMYLGTIAIVFYSLSTLSNGILQGIDRMRIPVRNAAIALVAQVVVLIICLLCFNLNIFAVVIANTFYALMMCILNELAVKKYSGAAIDLKRTFLIPGIVSVVMGLVVYVVYQLVNLIINSNLIATVLSIICGVVIYFVLMLLLRGITESELRRVPKGNVIIAISKKMHLI